MNFNSNTMNRRAVVLLVGVALVINFSQRVPAQDRVHPKQGVMVSGKIVEVTPAKVTIEVRGKNQNFSVSDIRKVTFDDEPTQLDRARESVLNEQYDQALEELKKIDIASIENVRVRNDVGFYLYYCQAQLALSTGGDKAAAIKGLLAVAAADRNTHHFYQLSEMLGNLAMAVGQPDKANNYYGVLLSAADADTQALGAYRLGEVELAQGKVNEAKKRFEQLARAPSKSAEMSRLKTLAEVGLAVCENEAGQPDSAIVKLRTLVRQNDSTNHELFARIYNAMGACHQKQGQTEQALLAYLKVDLLFFTEPEAHAEALFNLQALWPKVGEAARAADAKTRLVAQYASSSWANK